MNKCVREKLLRWISEQIMELFKHLFVAIVVFAFFIGTAILLHRLNVSFDDAFMTLCCAPGIIVVSILVIPISVYVETKKKLREIRSECAMEEGECQNGNS